MKKSEELPVIFFETPAYWEAWLGEHHQASSGLWLKLAKFDSGIPSVTYPQALDVALCYGWIDGQKASCDEIYWLQRFTPRRPKSNWSKINCDKAEALIAASRMQPAGLREVEAARADGRWEAAYRSQSQIQVPPDLQNELDRNPAALAFFATLDNRNRYAVLYRIETAKKPETRAARIRQFVEMLSLNKKIHP